MESQLLAVESPMALDLPPLEPTVVQLSRAAPGLSRNLGSGTGVECGSDTVGIETDEVVVEVGANIVTGFETIGAAINWRPLTDCPRVGTL